MISLTIVSIGLFKWFPRKIAQAYSHIVGSDEHDSRIKKNKTFF